MVEHIHAHGYSEYLKGGSWKCNKSPTQAHHWIVRSQITCKYCLQVKPLKLPDPGVVAPLALATIRPE